MNFKKNFDQVKARKLYGKMMTIFGGTFPDYYGGTFIDDNNNLNVLVVDGKEEMADQLRMMGIILKPCKFSYNELTGIMDKFNTFMLSHPHHEFYEDILSVYLFEEQNEITVQVISATPKFIEMFKTLISSSDAINIIEPNGSVCLKDTIDFPCGTKIESAKPSNMSLCCRVKKDKVEGFLTAGHAIPSLEPDKSIIYFFQSPIAVCTQMQNSEKIDAAFCEITDPDFIVSNKIDGTDFELDTATVEAIPGELVGFSGQRTSTAGKIVSTNLSFSINGTFFYDMVKTSFGTEPGDSGGIVYIYNPETDKCYVVGIQKGSFIGERMSFYCKIDHVLEAFGLKRY